MRKLKAQSWIAWTLVIAGACAADESVPPKRDGALGAIAAGAPHAPAAIAPWGFDLAGMQRDTPPGESLNSYANGGWLASNTIPADRTYWGTFAILRERNEQRVRELLEDPSPTPDGSSARKVKDFYAAYLASAAIEQRGLAPAEPGLERIAAASSHEQLAALLQDAELGSMSPISLEVALDDRDPDRYVVLVSQSGLALPDRDYYLDGADKYQMLRDAYLAHVERVQTLLGSKQAHAEAQAILELETRIAMLHWPADKRRQRELTYNPRTREALASEAQDFPLDAFLSGAQLPAAAPLVVAELDAVTGLMRAFRQTPVETWIAYLRYHYVAQHAQVLPGAIADECFDFYGRTLNGQAEQRDRGSLAVAALEDVLGQAVGELYVARYFPESYKQQLGALVAELRAAFSARIHDLSWMSEATKQAAQKKLDSFVAKIGYPDVWTDYTQLEVSPDDAFGNAVQARTWRWQEDLARLGKPADRTEWSMTPQTVNATYNPAWNEILFPAGLLQPPFFDPDADQAVNYGAIGAVIGHEMGHGFDDQGAKSDEHGVLRTWWQEEDERAFESIVDALVAQYDAYEPLPGVHVNGALTVGENIGDLGGLDIAYAAYQASLHGQRAPTLDGFTGQQRFFLGWAQIWRQLRREQSLRNLLKSDPHSPSALRVDGVVRNMDAFYEAFDVHEGEALWLAPEARVHIW